MYIKQRNLLALVCATALGLPSVIGHAQEPAAAPPAAGAPPPSAPAQRSAADLEKLVAPIALYPDPLIATVLPASVYPLEIVQAARFVKDTNNIPKVDQQNWDPSVKALARFPDVIAKMNDQLEWTSDLGQAFLAQQEDVMTAIQTMRGKANTAGTLKTTPQQTVVVTNTVVEKTVEQQVVFVTNTVVQIQPAQPEVIYVPQYNPTVVYAAPVGPTAGEVAAASVVSFGVGMAVGAIIANNNCDWHGGGVYCGGGWGGHGDVDVDVNRNVNVNNNVNRTANQNVNRTANQSANRSGTSQKWQPDPNRVRSSGAPGSTQTMESRGWTAPERSTTAANSGANRAPAGNAQNREPVRAGTTPNADRSAANANRPPPNTANANRPAPNADRDPANASRPTPSAERPTPNANRPAPNTSRPTPAPTASAPRSTGGGGGGGGSSAFGGVSNGGGDRSAGARGAASRGGGGGGRGGGGRR